MRFIWFLFLFKVLVLNVVGGKVSILQGNQFISAGQDRFLTCEMDDEEVEVVKVVWKKNDQALINNDKITISEDDMEMEIQSVEASDAGSYHCEVELEEGETEISAPVTLTLYEKIKFFACPESVVFEEGQQEGLVTCNVTSVPASRTSWTHAGKTIKKKNEKFQVKKGSLTLKSIVLADTAIYSFVAKQAKLGIRESFLVNVVVHEPIKVLSSREDINVTEGKDTQIVCKASGHPTPDFKFYNVNESNEGQNLEELEEFSVERKDGEATLLLKGAKPQHMGDIVCVAYNDYSQAKETFFINVLQAPRVTSFENVTSTATEKLEITCDAFANPPAFIEIGKVSGKDGDTESNKKQRSSTPVSSFTFTLDTTNLSDEGEYYCLTTHDGHSHFPDHQTTSHLEVIYIPQIDEENSTTAVKTWLGHPVELVCVVKANPTPRITWTSVGDDSKEFEVSFDNITTAPINATTSFTGYTSAHEENYYHSHIVIIPDHKDKIVRDLKCKASNHLGYMETILQVLEAFAPGLPEIKEIQDLTATSFSVVVGDVDDGGTAVTHYHALYYQEDNKTETQDTMKFPVADKVMIENLIQKTNYMVELKAENGVGISEASATNVTTKDRGTPLKVEVQMEPLACHDRNGVKVKWTEPYSSGLSINKYKIQFREVTPEIIVQRLNNETSDSSKETWMSTETEDISTKLEGLQPSTEYELYVQAHNDVGWSKEKDIHSFHICKDKELKIVILGFDRLPAYQASRDKATMHGVSSIVIFLTSLTTLFTLTS